MNPREIIRSILNLPSLSGYLAIISVAALIVPDLEPGVKSYIGWTAFILFGVLYTLTITQRSFSPFLLHLCIAVMTFLVAVPLVFLPMWSSLPMMFFVLSSLVMLFFSQRVGFIWIGVFTLVTVVIFMVWGDFPSSLLESLPFAAGYWFFGAFAHSLAIADEARCESQELYRELQIAHRQLQEYAARVEELAVSEERNRMAREMHDTLGHRLTVAAVQLEGAQRLIPDNPGRAAEMIETVREQVRDALGELRRTVATLREPLQTDIPFPASLMRLVDSFRDATGLDVRLNIPGKEIFLPEAQRLAFYRVVQEALTNIQRHAQAKTVQVDLALGAGKLVLRIIDDGVGIALENQDSGFGLRGVCERVSQLAGAFFIEPRVEGGTLLEVSLPFSLELTSEETN
ncbi:MAG: sensor histidine kinase [Anaerolineales bacterium]|nr:sensor histidine kinase [Anaerolineales bacterium]